MNSPLSYSLDTSKDGDITVLESAGNVILFQKENGQYFAEAKESGKSKPIYSIASDNNYEIIGADTRAGVNYLAYNKESSDNIQLWRSRGNSWKQKKLLGEYKPGTEDFFQSELLLQQDLNTRPSFSRASKPLSNDFWAHEEFTPMVWGIYNFGQYTGSRPGADGKVYEVFATQSSPYQGLKNKNQVKQKNTVAVIDTGLNYDHQDLSRNWWSNEKDKWGDGIDNDKNGYIDDTFGADFVNNRGIAWDDQGHGTHVAGTIGSAANNVGLIGTNPAAEIMSIKVLGKNGSGYTSDIIEGVNYAVKNNAKVINMSLGSYSYSKSLFSALKQAQKKNSLIIAAAGNESNDNDKNPSYPASYNLDSIISVASSTMREGWSRFTNYGARTVDIYAPGEDIYSASHKGNSSYLYQSGTSMAAPFVSGVVSAYWARNPKLKPSKVKSRLLSTVDRYPQYGLTVSGGRINAARFNGVGSGKSNMQVSDFEVDNIQDSTTTKSADMALIVTKKNFKNLDVDMITGSIVGRIGSFENRSSRARTFEKIEKKAENLGFKDAEVNRLESLNSGLFVINNLDSSDKQKLELIGGLLRRGIVDYFEVDTLFYAI